MALDRLPEDLVKLEYLYYALKSRGFVDAISGSAQPQITGQGLSEVNVPIAPIAEQREIARRLDELLAQVDILKTRLDAIPSILKRFRQSTLAAAVSGKLIPSQSDFLSAPFSNLIHEMKNGLSPKPNEVGAGDPILRISSVRPLSIDQDDHRYLECDEKTRHIYALEDEDLLFTRYNGSLDFVGVCGLYKVKKHDVLLYPDKLIRVRTDKKLLIAEYAEIYFSAPQIRRIVTVFIKIYIWAKGHFR